jgi:hypothetical protein
MNPPSEDIKDMLDSSSVGAGVGTYGVDLFYNTIPPTPDACVVVLDSGGFDPEPRFEHDIPTVQVRVRGAKRAHRAAYVKAQAVKAALHGKAGEEWNGTWYILILQEGEILPLGRDENERPELTLNFKIDRHTKTP